MSALSRVKSLDDAAREIDRLERRVVALERALGISRMSTEPVEGIKYEKRVLFWYDRENGQIKVNTGNGIETFTKD